MTKRAPTQTIEQQLAAMTAERDEAVAALDRANATIDAALVNAQAGENIVDDAIKAVAATEEAEMAANRELAETSWKLEMKINRLRTKLYASRAKFDRAVEACVDLEEVVETLTQEGRDHVERATARKPFHMSFQTWSFTNYIDQTTVSMCADGRRRRSQRGQKKEQGREREVGE